MKKFSNLVVSLTLLLTAVGASSWAHADSCVQSNQLQDYRVVDDTHMIFKTNFDGSYLFTLSDGCDLRFMDYPVFEHFSSFLICVGDTVKTVERGIGQTGFCSINAITKQ